MISFSDFSTRDLNCPQKNCTIEVGKSCPEFSLKRSKQLVHLLDDQMLNIMREGKYLPSFMTGDHKKTCLWGKQPGKT